MRFAGNFFLNACRNFLDDDIIIVTSSVHRTQSALYYFPHQYSVITFK